MVQVEILEIMMQFLLHRPPPISPFLEVSSDFLEQISLLPLLWSKSTDNTHLVPQISIYACLSPLPHWASTEHVLISS